MFFFFSSRRRHTRYWRDWSSDVCSSDLPTLADPFYDKGSRYSAPYVTYSTGIGWRTDMVPADVAGMDNPWEIFWDPTYKGITGLYDEYRDALSVGMYRSGLTQVNDANPSDLNKARDNLLELPDL